MITVLVVDDHAVFREGVRALLARVPGIEVVGEASTTDEAVAAAADLAPEVILMDLNIPGGGGESATEVILAAAPATSVLMLTMYTDPGHLRGALQAGARGYLVKDAEPDAIVRAIEAVHAGQVIFSPDIGGQVIAASVVDPAEGRAFPALTPREYEILDRMARGVRNDAIALRMGISLKTVQNNISSILLKLGAVDRAQAVTMAREAGVGLSVRAP